MSLLAFFEPREFEPFRNVVGATLCPGITTNYSPSTENKPLKNAMLFEGLIGVLRTAGVELAISMREEYL